ncbi:hypothetical protein BD770DRAFT_360905 [Pilaira anomala]|nr:hypothetical protein BD770DRAFT_360905 [Pilaira anomala]
MGNSQSMDGAKHALKEGIKIYKSLKDDQDHHQQQQQQQQHYYQQSSSSHYPSPPISGDDQDDQYTHFRNQAGEQAQKRNACYAESQEAYSNGDGARAKELSNQGHYHDDLMKQYNQQACDHIYSVNNQGRPSNQIDLHGLYVKEASQKVEEAIQRCQREGASDLTIIVGKGLHSPNQIAKLKPAIIDLVKKYNVSCQPNIPNPGCLYVEFGKGTGDLSWLDRLTDRMSNDQCFIM